jgi:hypothetical protein
MYQQLAETRLRRPSPPQPPPHRNSSALPSLHTPPAHRPPPSSAPWPTRCLCLRRVQEVRRGGSRSSHPSSRPPRTAEPHAGQGGEHGPHGIRHFYSSSVPKSHQGGGSRPKRSILGESPPSHSVGWLMGSTPPDGSGLYGSSPGSYIRRWLAAAAAAAAVPWLAGLQ